MNGREPDPRRRRSGGEPSEHSRRVVAALANPSAMVRAVDDPARIVEDVLELAGIDAEIMVGRRAPARRRWGRGRCHVLVFFNDPRLLDAFRSVAALHRAPRTGWVLVRRWADADGDARLDEDMCLAVVRRLQRTFGWRLRARVIAIYDRS